MQQKLVILVKHVKNFTCNYRIMEPQLLNYRTDWYRYTKFREATEKIWVLLLFIACEPFLDNTPSILKYKTFIQICLSLFTMCITIIVLITKISPFNL